jgi:hypothetical protein
MVLTDPVLEVIRRELRRVSPDVKIDINEIKTVLQNEVLKREVTEGDKAEEAKKRISRTMAKAAKAKATAKETSSNNSEPSATNTPEDASETPSQE